MANVQEHRWEVQWKVYSTQADLPQSWSSLLAEARTALAKAHAPYSQFQVGAAVRLVNGEVLSGANFENAAYPMCLCAERSAIAAAVSTFPQDAIEAMAITVRNVNNPVLMPAAPCGACRQVLVETEMRQQHNIELLLAGEEGKAWVFRTAKELLPFYFDGSLL